MARNSYTDATGVKEADVYQCLIHYLKSLLDSGKGRHWFDYLLLNMLLLNMFHYLKSLLDSGKGRHWFNYLLLNMFGCDYLRD